MQAPGDWRWSIEATVIMATLAEARSPRCLVTEDFEDAALLEHLKRGVARHTQQWTVADGAIDDRRRSGR
jgi:hypothetical protein